MYKLLKAKSLVNQDIFGDPPRFFFLVERDPPLTMDDCNAILAF